MTKKVDFVLTWVDGNDPEWQKTKSKYTKKNDGDDREIRFRDWENLQYWFRGVEKFTPWVNKIHFVTWGHVPEWLNVKHPKINIVFHQDFIPKKYLPTFSSHAIELNLHRIKGLSETFVYFNDDTFIIKKMDSDDFFKKGLPCDIAVIMPIINKFRYSTGAIASNNMEVINTNYDKNTVLRRNFLKWFNLSYKKYLISTLLMLPYKQFPGFLNQHLPNSFLKSTFEDLWASEYEILDKTCENKLRDGRDVNQWLMRFKQLVEGNFIPRNPNIGRTYNLTNNNEDVEDAILNQKYKMVCINDNNIEPIRDFEKEKNLLINTFQQILPGKSSFEI